MNKETTSIKEVFWAQLVRNGTLQEERKIEEKNFELFPFRYEKK